MKIFTGFIGIILLCGSGFTPSSPEPVTAEKAQVVVVSAPDAVLAFEPKRSRVAAMVATGIKTLSNQADLAAAWRSLVAPGEQIGIKVLTRPGPITGTRLAVVEAVVQGLLEAGVPAHHILVWDKRQGDLRRAGFLDLSKRYGIEVTGAMQAGFDENSYYETALLGHLVWGDLEFGQTGEGVGRKSYVSKLVTQRINKIIQIVPLLNHNLAGVSGNLYSLAFGSVDNTQRFHADADRMAVAVPEICALPALRNRVALNIVDALICQYLGEETGLLHYSIPLNQLWFSADPLALDTLSIQELELQRQVAGMPAGKTNWELYQNAALVELGVLDTNRIHIVRKP